MPLIAICGALALAVLAAISLPLLSGGYVARARALFDRAVYRDQLREVERDVARGVLDTAEANAARLEIQRRLLAVGRNVAGGGVAPGEGHATAGGAASARSPGFAAAIAIFLVAIAGGLYWHLGSPALPDVPFADRQAMQADAPDDEAAASHAEIAQTAVRLEQNLRADPTNASEWLLYARATSVLGQWRKAADAYKHAIDLGRTDPDVFSGYGEMQVMAADGIVAPAAGAAFKTALAADASNGVARYYLALADDQAGDEHKAVDAWLALAAGLPEGAPMRDEIARRVAAAARNGGFEAPPMPKGTAVEASGPTPEQIASAAAMPPADRARMIEGMIDQLATRLRDRPNDLDGWLRLGRAYMVLGHGPQSVDAYDRALALKPGDPGIKLRIVAALLAGLKPGEAPPPRAATLLDDVAAAAPDAPEVLWYLGEIAVRDGRVAEAREKWTKLLGALPAGGEDSKMVRAALGELKGP